LTDLAVKIIILNSNAEVTLFPLRALQISFS